jgi:hypothetical protein
LFTSGAGCAVIIPVAVSVTINCISSTTERGGEITGLSSLFAIVYVTPNPKTIIRLDAQDKQGRYVRIQLLNKNYLSLAEVQVIGGEQVNTQ